MQLRPEYEKIRSDAVHMAALGIGDSYIDAIREAVERCQALADKPPKELTDAEIKHACDSIDFSTLVTADDYIYVVSRAAIAAHIAKHKEPEVVKVNVSVYRKTNGEIIARCNHESLFVDAKLLKTETLEVTLP